MKTTRYHLILINFNLTYQELKAKIVLLKNNESQEISDDVKSQQGRGPSDGPHTHT